MPERRCLLCGDPQQPSAYMAESAAILAERGIELARIDWREELSPAAFRDVTMEMEERGPADYDASAIEAALDGIEVLIVHKAPVSANLIDAAPDLEIVGAARGGTENVDVGACRERGIAVFHAPGRNKHAVADYAVGLLLARVRGIPGAHAATAAGGWPQTFDPEALPRDLPEQTVGIVGFGNVGREVAGRLEGFGAERLVHDPYVADDEIAATGAEPVSLDDLLARADAVTLHVRLSDETRGLIGADAFAAMKDSAVLVNTARGGLVDEDALVDALGAGELAGAALDVFQEEPLPEGHPLRGRDDVLLTPHVAGSTRDAVLNGGRIVAEGILEHLDGGAPDNRIA